MDIEQQRRELNKIGIVRVQRVNYYGYTAVNNMHRIHGRRRLAEAVRWRFAYRVGGETLADGAGG
jgi:hypothetical protein